MTRSTIRIGIVGYSRNQFNWKKATSILKDLYKELKKNHKDKEVEIVSGYTNVGVPKIAYQLAEQFDFTTVGFTAKEALSIDIGLYPVQKVFIVGDKFGDESEDFIKYIDGLIRIGGGNQSLKEVEMFKARSVNETLQGPLKEFDVD